jgi:hypothetical protein
MKSMGMQQMPGGNGMRLEFKQPMGFKQQMFQQMEEMKIGAEYEVGGSSTTHYPQMVTTPSQLNLGAR